MSDLQSWCERVKELSELFSNASAAWERICQLPQRLPDEDLNFRTVETMTRWMPAPLALTNWPNQEVMSSFTERLATKETVLGGY